MKKKLLLINLLLLCFVFTVKAQIISFTFTANHTCTYAPLDSVLIENLTQGGDTTLYWNDTVLSFNFSNIEMQSVIQNDFYVSQNYPNPFETQTRIDVFVPEKDNFTISVFDITGRKVIDYENTLRQGLHNFTFYAGNSDNYILTVNSTKYSQKILMLRIGSTNNSLSKLVYNENIPLPEIRTKQKSLKSSFPYAIGDDLKFTGFINGNFVEITDNPENDKEYIFDIANSVPEIPAAGTNVSGENEIEWNWNDASGAVGYKYNTINDYETAFDNGISTQHIQPGLDCGMTYTLYVWAYNNCGNSEALVLTEDTEMCPHICGDDFIDTRDAMSYTTVQIGEQCWLAENLKFLPSVVGQATGSQTEPYYYVYDYDGTNVNDAIATVNYDTYGVLYNWTAAMTACPEGWHLPSDAKWTQLTDYLSANSQFWCESNSDNIAKSLAEDSGWNTSPDICDVGNDQASNNITGFTARPSGVRNTTGNFAGLVLSGSWWAATTHGGVSAWNRGIYFNYSVVERPASDISIGRAVRCLKD